MPQREYLNAADFDAIRLRIASPEIIKSWSYGEVTKPETINYRTQKPEKGGLFAEEIFGPTKDWECYCGKYKKIRYRGLVCDKCGVEVTHSLVRRERMGHIELCSPVAHIWFLRSIPSKIGTVLDISVQALEKVVYFASFVIISVDEALKVETQELLRSEYKSKRKQLENELKMAPDVTVVERKMTALEEEFVQADRELKEITPLRVMSEQMYQELSLRYGHLFDAGIGAEAVATLLKSLNLEKTIESLDNEIEGATGTKRDRLVRRSKTLKALSRNGISAEWMIMGSVPVIPPDLRPMVPLDGGRFATSDLNDLYRRVINRNNRLKRLLELNAPEVIVRNEKRMLQEAVDALIDNNARRTKSATVTAGRKRELRSLADLLKGKQGRFRANLLGKRTDYSGRSVIVVGPNLRIHECGLPKRMALELFKPFIMAKIIARGLAHNIRSAARYIEQEHDEVWDILEEVSSDTRVLLNRAPTLHRLGIQAFKPRLIEGKAIQLHPLVCTAFNADFDGDQMAVHVPLTVGARKEAEELMAAERGIIKPATGQPIATPKQDVGLGLFYMTNMREPEDGKIKAFYSPGEATLAYKTRHIKLQQKIKVRMQPNVRLGNTEPILIETCIGRVFFNELLDTEFPWYNEIITVKKLGEIIRYSLERKGEIASAELLDRVKDIGFRYVTKSGYSLGMDDFPRLPHKHEMLAEGDRLVSEIELQYAEGLLTQSERHNKIIDVWTEIKDRIVAKNRDYLNKFGPVFSMIESGARGSWGQLTQVIGMKGLVSSPSGDIIELPVKGSFKEGFDVLEFFISSHGVRKGLSDTALRTANAGYLTRRLVDVAQDVVVTEEDCGEDVGVMITFEESESIGEKVHERVLGRYTLSDIKIPGSKKVLVKAGDLINESAARAIEAEKIDNVHVRSVLKCRMPKGICIKCYGTDLGHNQPVRIGQAVGIIAAQSIGEPGTQLTMRTFHTGGVAGTDITKGLPRVEELFEARTPKKKAVIADVAGQVQVVSADGRIIESPTGRRIFEGRRGQKIVKVTFEGVDEERYRLEEGDTVIVKEGKKVKKGLKLMTRASGEAVEAQHDGIAKVDDAAVRVVFEGGNEKEYIIPVGYKILVKDGDLIGAGDALTEGHIELQQLHELKGKVAVQNYILKEIQDIYSSQGQKLNDKHVEVILRQMFSRVYVTDAGDTDLIPGEIVEKAQVADANRHAKKGEKRAHGRELFLGVSKVSLSTQSFLSAASFQDTARVLIGAAITGKTDYLEGLKENVIIGRLIPAGTGYEARRQSGALPEELPLTAKEAQQVAEESALPIPAAEAAEMA